MKYIRSSLLALLMACAAHAQTASPAKPAQPAAPARPAKVAHAPDSGESSERAANEDEELAIAALEGLMTQSPARSLPILKKVLAGSQPTVVKRRALFVLAQNNSPEAHELLMQIARTPNQDLQREAIRSVGISGDPKSLDGLQEVYTTADARTRKDILQAWMIAGRKQSVYQVAANAKDEDEASEAIRMLGVMGAHDELRKLGDKPSASKSLLEAYAISGDVTSLRKVADTSPDHALRVDATRRIGIVHSDAARTALREIYTGSTDQDIKSAALQGMLIAQDDEGVLALYKAASTTDEKRKLLRTLSMMNGDAAIEAIDATLEKKP